MERTKNVFWEETWKCCLKCLLLCRPANRLKVCESMNERKKERKKYLILSEAHKPTPLLTTLALECVCMCVFVYMCVCVCVRTCVCLCACACLRVCVDQCTGWILNNQYTHITYSFHLKRSNTQQHHITAAADVSETHDIHPSFQPSILVIQNTPRDVLLLMLPYRGPTLAPSTPQTGPPLPGL